MGYSNLPPGCRVSDLPGNRPEDDWSDAFWDALDGTVSSAADKDRRFYDRVEEASQDYSPLEDDPEYAAQRVSERLLKDATLIMEEP